MTGDGPGLPEGRLPSEDEREVPDPAEVLGADHDERVGIFPSWRWLYATVFLYTAIVVLLLYLFTVSLDVSAR